MTSASVDRLLAILVVGLSATGIGSLWLGAASGTWVFIVHAWLAGVLVTATFLKLRASVPRAIRARRWAPLALSLALTFLVVGALAAGYLWAASGTVIWVDVAGLIRWSVLTIHAWLGLAVLPIVVLHLVPRRWRLLRPGSKAAATAATRMLSRRALVTGTALGAISIGLSVGAASIERVVGESRRFTGSRLLPPGGLPPSTTFLGEATPAIDLDAWRLEASAPDGQRAAFTLDDLRAIGADEVTATLDCTSGWALTTTWQGVRLGSVLDAAGGAGSARHVEIRSITGWSATLPMAEARACLLAWSVSGQPLPLANGAPLRLVAPDHRGLEWVKWVASIRAV